MPHRPNPTLEVRPELSRSGVVVLDRRTAKHLDFDEAARDLIEIPPEHSSLEPHHRPAPKVLDAQGRPSRAGALFPYVRPHVPLSAIRGIKWKSEKPWRWFRVNYLSKESDPTRIVVLVNRIPDELAPRVRAWECATCRRLTTAVGECPSCGRDFCLACWLAHPGCERKVDKRPTVRCPSTGAVLHGLTCSQMDLNTWCRARETGEPCTPECGLAIRGLTDTQRFKPE